VLPFPVALEIGALVGRLGRVDTTGAAAGTVTSNASAAVVVDSLAVIAHRS
jgi:hypothetical protein